MVLLVEWDVVSDLYAAERQNVGFSVAFTGSTTAVSATAFMSKTRRLLLPYISTQRERQPTQSPSCSSTCASSRDSQLYISTSTRSHPSFPSPPTRRALRDSTRQELKSLQQQWVTSKTKVGKLPTASTALGVGTDPHGKRKESTERPLRNRPKKHVPTRSKGRTTTSKSLVSHRPTRRGRQDNRSRKRKK
ncbi:hypothetical protein BDV95DRAFT_338097 [Massariosphaeria phaeospora]|uniref:Uncharacterized protein n=1 Tax=Massariosphaeria phaeospora TaxID=100035 RepID=A0A7C8MRL3_9PLEO|nr:hypothetical protein BDV95DRAFT_338097 [Massariosphaeria phaeospora]